jgi:hypothetical protein
MTLLDILEKAINNEFGYGDACQALKELKLPYETQEKYEILLYKLLGDERSVTHDPEYFFTGIPNNQYYTILSEVIGFVRKGLYTPEIAQHIFNKYALSAPLMTYFINEAISIVRMNTLSPEEVANIGEAYHKIATSLESKGIKEKPQIEIESEEDGINAEPIGEINIEQIEE